ncbi:FtsK/SpoIIIE domain-containing protein [Flexivirga sp. B27]
MTTAPPEAPSSTSRSIRLDLVASDLPTDTSATGTLVTSTDAVTLCLRAPDGTTWAAARDAIRGCGVSVHDELYVGSRLLEDDTPLGRAPLVNGAQLSVQPTAAEARHLLELVVTEGPEVGARTALGPQVQRIGRATSNTLPLQDPDLSRTHLVVDLDQGRAMVSDAGSTNGSHIDGRRLSPERPAELRAGQRLRAGSTTFALERSVTVDTTVPTDESCRVPFQRSARIPLQINETELTRPTPPSKPERHRMPWPVVVLPAVIAVVMVLVMHNMMFLMFAFFGPVMMIGQHLNDRQGGSSRAKTQRAEFAEALRRLEADKESARETEVALRRRITPPISETLRSVSSRDNRLWSRSPAHHDYLHCRVGIGRIPSRVRVTGGGRGTETLLLSEAPISFCANESRVVGVTGASTERDRMAHGLVLQLATWQSPHFLRIIVVCDSAATSEGWSWAEGLPHITAAPHASSTILDVETDESACVRALSALLPEKSEMPVAHSDDHPVRTVVVLDGCALLGNRPEVTALLRDVESAGVAVIAIGAAADLPAECDLSIEVSSSTTLTVTGAITATGCPDLPDAFLARGVASRLAAIRDATPDTDSGALPERAALLDVWRDDACDATESAAVARQWQASPRSTIAPLGRTGDGTLRIDLATDGPHGLIAGTTGAGKSELLQSLVTSLALANRPDEMVFVLVDYKGGAAFQDCARLPHTVGLVTDLDAHLTARALTSLGAEVRRREQLLAGVGAKDIEDYQRIPDVESLPRLVLVIDEFRVLAEEMPDFISGLVRLAAVGRSLGIHLVLATQRPAGVVSADIRANVNLRIALRVRDGADSQDVIDNGDAAQIPAALPGRAILRTGGGRPVTFQTARIGGCSSGDTAQIEVSVAGHRGGLPTRLSALEEADGPTDLQRTVTAIRQATTDLAITPPPSPWLPPLPAAVTTEKLTDAPYAIGGDPCGPESIILGLMDVPQQQQTRPVAWDLETDGHLAIVGGPRSGRTSLLRTLAVQAAHAWPRSGLAVYVVDAGSNLGALTALPQVGAVVDRDDTGRLTQLVEWLAGEIRSRQQQFARDQVSGFAEHVHDGGHLPRILLLIDGWESLTEISEETTFGRLTEEVLQLLRDGSAVGLYAAATGGRGLATGRVVSSFSTKLMLRLADSADAMLLGMREADLPQAMPAGRALTCPDGLELQVATPIADVSGSAVAQHISAIAQEMEAHDVHRFAPMPEHCLRTDLPSSAEQIFVGVGGAEIAPIGLPLGGFGELAAVVAGPPRSGRTTALVTIAHQLPDRPVCWLAGHGVPPSLPEHVDVLDATAPEAFAEWLNAHPGGAVLVDDLDEMLGTPTDDLLADYLQHGRRAGGIVCASGRSDTLANAYRGACAELRRKQTGIILQPGRRDGNLLGAQLGPAGRPTPGRGALVIRTRPVPIQVAS